jgi:HSP20 family molecular chaperone IbpA
MQERVAAETYETAAEVVVRVALPEDVDAESATTAIHDGTLEIRLPRRDVRERTGGLVGFHPDAPPS